MSLDVSVGIGFEPTPEQRELQALAHEFAERELRPIAAEWDERDEFPPDLLAKAARLGLTSYAVPAEYGGGGVGAVTAALIAEELSWGCAGLASTIQATMFLVRPLVRFGTQEQRDRYLPRLASEDGLPRRDRVHRGPRRLGRGRDRRLRAPRRRLLRPARARRSTSRTAGSRS